MLGLASFRGGGPRNADWSFPLSLSGVVDSFDASLASSLTVSDGDKVDAWQSKLGALTLVGSDAGRPSFAGTGTTKRISFVHGTALSLATTTQISGLFAVLSGISGMDEIEGLSSRLLQAYTADPMTLTDFAFGVDDDAFTFGIVDSGSGLSAGIVGEIGINGVVEADDAFTGYVPFPDTAGNVLVYSTFSVSNGTVETFDWNYLGNPSGSTQYAINELLILSATPSETVRQKCEGYLAWKWGVEDNLPIDHPYKDAAPTS